MKIVFSKKAYQDFLFFKKENKKEYAKIKELILNIQETPFHGIGKPEPLKNDLASYWSRRITKKDRLVYSIKDKQITILSCRFHY